MDGHKPPVDDNFEDTPIENATVEPPPPATPDPPAGGDETPAGTEEETPTGDTLESTLAALSTTLSQIPERVGEAVTKAVEKVAPAKETPAAPSEIDAIMQTLEDQPQELQDAVRTALERGARVETVLAEMQGAADQQALVNDISKLSQQYPGLTEADVKAVLEKIVELDKQNPALADALSMEEIASRAIGRDALNARRTKAAAPSGNPPPKKGAPPVPAAKPKPAAAQIVADATPGAGEVKPYDPGPGNDFSDIARHITETAGDTLVIRK